MLELAKLTDDAIQRLSGVEGCELKDGCLYRKYTFEDFVETFGFMTSVALLAEKQFHHPEWHDVFNTVDIKLSTHEVSGISEKDFVLSDAISKIRA